MDKNLLLRKSIFEATHNIHTKKESNLAEEINEKEKFTISNVYNLNRYKQSIKRLTQNAFTSKNFPRYNLTMYGRLGDDSPKFRVIDISKKGLQIFINESLSVNSKIFTLELKTQNSKLQLNNCICQTNLAKRE